jgi:hypothetical protein
LPQDGQKRAWSGIWAPHRSQNIVITSRFTI